jgi:hypothetical protein
LGSEAERKSSIEINILRVCSHVTGWSGIEMERRKVRSEKKALGRV